MAGDIAFELINNVCTISLQSSSVVSATPNGYRTKITQNAYNPIPRTLTFSMIWLWHAVEKCSNDAFWRFSVFVSFSLFLFTFARFWAEISRNGTFLITFRALKKSRSWGLICRNVWSNEAGPSGLALFFIFFCHRGHRGHWESQVDKTNRTFAICYLWFTKDYLIEAALRFRYVWVLRCEKRYDI